MAHAKQTLLILPALLFEAYKIDNRIYLSVAEKLLELKQVAIRLKHGDLFDQRLDELWCIFQAKVSNNFKEKITIQLKAT